MRARSFVLAAAIGLLLAPAPAGADALRNAETALEPVVRRMALEISPCLAAGGDRIRRVALVGVPLFNRHLEAADRGIVNAALDRVVSGVSGWRAVPVEIGGVLPSILNGGPRAAETVKALLDQRADAPLILAADTARPDSDTLTLRLALFGRDASGALGCAESATLELDAATFAALPATTGTGTDYVLLRGALAEAMSRMGSRIAVADRLALETDASALPDGCVLKRDLADITADIVFSLRNEGLDLGANWPAIVEARNGTAPDDIRTLRVEVRPSTPAPQAVRAVIGLSGPQGLLDRALYDALVPPNLAAGCGPPPVVATVTPGAPEAPAVTVGAEPASDAASADGLGGKDVASTGEGTTDDDPEDASAGGGTQDGAVDTVAAHAATASDTPSAGTADSSDVAAGPDAATDEPPGSGATEPDAAGPAHADADTDGTPAGEREPAESAGTDPAGADADGPASGDASAGEDLAALDPRGGDQPDSTNEPPARTVEDPAFVFFAEKQTYRTGEAVTVTLVAPKDCDLTLVNVDDRGRSCVVVPTPGLDDIRLEAGVPYRFPPAGATWTFPEAGTETLIALCNASDAAVEEVRTMTEPVSCAEGGESADDYEKRVLELGVLAFSGPVVRRTLTLEIAP